MQNYFAKSEYKRRMFSPEIKYTTVLEKLLIVIGIASSIGAGICMPMMTVLFGRVYDSFLYNELTNITYSNYEDKPSGSLWFHENNSRNHNHLASSKEALQNFVNGMFIVGAVEIIFGIIFITTLNYAAIKQVQRLGRANFRVLLYNQIGWFDLQHPQDISYNIIRNINNLHDGLGEKMGIMLYTMAVSITCLAFAVSYNWKLALISMIILPLVMLFFFFIKKTKHCLKTMEKIAYGPSETLAKDVIMNMRSVVAYHGEKLESKRFKKSLEASEMSFIRRSSFVGLLSGCLWFVMYCCYALTFHSGVTILQDSHNTDNLPSTLIIVFFCVQIGIINMLSLPGYIKVITKARGAALNMHATSETTPLVYMEQIIDLSIPENFKSISFKRVNFCYPSKPHIKVLQEMTFTIHEGENVVLTGVSGCGKTSCLRLIHRFYDAQSGTIEINNMNIYRINLNKLRRRIGYVQQNSVLFGTTIIQSVCYGLQNIPRKHIQHVLRIVGITESISHLSKQYSSPLSDDLKPGLRQRLAIARVLLQKPDILILDGAMTDLSVKEELNILKGIIEYREHKTMITVSSRIPTMMIANKVIYIKEGHVYAQGSFHQLITQRGEFWDIIKWSTTLKSRLKPGLDSDSIDEFEPKPCERISRMYNLSSYSLVLQSTDSNEGEYLHHDTVHICHFPVPLALAERPVVVGLQGRDIRNFSWLKVLKLNAKEWPFMLIGCVAALITGFSLPAYAVLFVESLTEIAVKPMNEFTLMRDFFTYMFLIAGFVAGVAMIVQGYMMAVSGSKLIKRLRCLTFDAILRQEMAWFDDKKNNLQSLLKLLREDSHRAQSASGYRLMSFTQALCLVMTTALLSMYYEWKLGLFVCFAVPFMFMGFIYQMQFGIGKIFQESLLLQKTKLTVDKAVLNIRAITALNLQDMFAAQFDTEMLLMEKKFLGAMKWQGVIYGFMLGIPWIIYGSSAYLGGQLLKIDAIQQENMLNMKDIWYSFDMARVLEALVLGTIMMGQLTAFSPYQLQGQLSTMKIMKLLQRIPAIYSPTVNFHAKQRVRGNIDFRNVNFVHENVRYLPALKNFNMDVTEGQTVALIGNLGSGQTIPIQLIMRFYFPQSGTMLLNGYNIASLNLATLRGQIGLVNGDPVFFQRTIAENIAYGQNSYNVKMDIIISAAKEADLHNYVTTLPEGYNTLLTESMVASMSFSQKFRISLARALIRDPSILLVENFEMAEDEHSDMLVDAALRRACIGRTCLIVSRHIVAAVWNASKIFVMCNGEVAEEGTHSSLLDARNLYYRLYCRQELLQRVTESQLLMTTLMNEEQ